MAILPMPERYLHEMLADWEGAGRAIKGTNETAAWYAKNRHKMRLHPQTQAAVDRELLGVKCP